MFWAPGVEPDEQALELAAVVAALELAAVAVVAAAVAAAVAVVVAAVAAACTAAVSRPPERQYCWWRCVGGWMRRQPRLHSSLAPATCFLRAEPEEFILCQEKRRDGGIQQAGLMMENQGDTEEKFRQKEWLKVFTC